MCCIKNWYPQGVAIPCGHWFEHGAKLRPHPLLYKIMGNLPPRRLLRELDASKAQGGRDGAPERDRHCVASVHVHQPSEAGQVAHWSHLHALRYYALRNSPPCATGLRTPPKQRTSCDYRPDAPGTATQSCGTASTTAPCPRPPAPLLLHFRKEGVSRSVVLTLTATAGEFNIDRVGLTYVIPPIIDRQHLHASEGNPAAEPALGWMLSPFHFCTQLRCDEIKIQRINHLNLLNIFYPPSMDEFLPNLYHNLYRK